MDILLIPAFDTEMDEVTQTGSEALSVGEIVENVTITCDIGTFPACVTKVAQASCHDNVLKTVNLLQIDEITADGSEGRIWFATYETGLNRPNVWLSLMMADIAQKEESVYMFTRTAFGVM